MSAVLNLGVVKPGSTLYLDFQTFSSDDPAASMTITGLATTDIEIYKNGSVTQRSSDSGYSLLDTDGIDFDGTTGIHGISIDLADNTDAGFFVAGAQYTVVIASITLDAATINFILAKFTIGYPGAFLDTTIATLASQTSFTLTAGSTDNDAYNGWKAVVHDVASAVQICLGYVSDYVGSTKTVTLAADPGIFTMAAGDNISLFPPDNVAAVAGLVTNATNLGSAAANYSATRGLAGTALPAAAADGAGGLPISDAGGLDLDSVLSGNVPQTGDSYARLGAPAGASIAADLVVIDDFVDALETRIPDVISLAAINAEVDTALSDIGLQYLLNTALPTDWSTNVTANSALDYMADDGTAVYDRTTDSLQALADSGGGGPTAAQIADAVWDEAQADHTSAGSFGEIATEIAAILVDTAEIGAAGAGLTEAGGTGDQLTAVPWNAAWDAEVQSEVNDGLVAFWTSPATLVDLIWDETLTAHATADSAAVHLKDILADTNELQSDDYPTTLATIVSDIATVDGNVDAILVDTGTTIPGVLTTIAGYLDTEIAAILEDTGTTLPAQIAALNNIAASDVLTQVNAALDTSISELGVATPTATPTLRTGLMLLYMALRNKRATTGATDEIYNDAGTVIATAVLSDDTVEFIKGEYA